VSQVRFDRILPALERGEADLGLCIHEARFTWRAFDVDLVEDLGETWERATGAPLALGGLAGSRAVEPAALAALARATRASLEWALAHRERCLPTMRRHAQESSDDVLFAHVDTYVGERTLDLGPDGARALERLAELARARGLVPRGARLDVVGA